MKRFKRGIAIEYVLLAMALVSAIIVVILTTASLSTQTASSHKKYIEKKTFLDGAAGQYIRQVQESGSADGLQEQFSENDFNFQFAVDTQSLVVSSPNGSVVLVVELEKAGDEYKLITYRYGVL